MAPAAQSDVMLDDALPFMLWRARPDMSTITISRLPGEGREIYAKVGYSY